VLVVSERRSIVKERHRPDEASATVALFGSDGGSRRELAERAKDESEARPGRLWETARTERYGRREMLLVVASRES
jgi:hypothetical protein